jgi:hypothetical protein
MSSKLFRGLYETSIRGNRVFRDVLRPVRRSLGLSPMQKVLRRLRARGINLRSLRALELFGGSGAYHTVDYSDKVGSLEVWEIDPQLEHSLRANLPDTTVRIVDCYAELRRTPDRFDFVIVDNPMSTYDGHCEHFDLFPDIFRVLSDQAVLLLDVIPLVPPVALKRFPYLFNDEQRKRRGEFYGTSVPDHLSSQTMVSAYRQQAELAGFEVEWSFMVRRHFVFYLALKIRRHGCANH